MSSNAFSSLKIANRDLQKCFSPTKYLNAKASPTKSPNKKSPKKSPSKKPRSENMENISPSKADQFISPTKKPVC